MDALRVAWPSFEEQGGWDFGNALGFATHSAKARAAFIEAGGIIDSDAPTIITVGSPSTLKPDPKRRTVFYTAWESHELPEALADNMRGAAAIIVTSEFLRAPFARALPGVPIHVCELGVDHETFAYRERASLRPGENFIVLFVGGSSKRKGWEPLVHAWPLVVRGWRRRDCFPRLIVKTTAPTGRIVEIADHRVTFDSRKLPREKLADMFREASLCVLPSWGEGACLPALEAAACGCALAAPLHTAISDTFGAGSVFPIRWEERTRRYCAVDHVKLCQCDHRSIADAILEAADDPKRARKKARRAFAAVKHRTWAATGDALLAVLARLMQRS
jgi:glycosyltransferase involved in cell wall biosynthesis